MYAGKVPPETKASPRIRAVPAVTRALAILRLLARHSSPVPLKTIAAELDLIPSTALHILRALIAEQVIRFDPATKRYSLGVGLLPLARAALEQSAFPELVRPTLDQLSRDHNVSAIATEVPDLNRMIVVALASAPGPVRLNVDVGTRFPALIHATGRCVAAFSDCPWEDIENAFRRLTWEGGPDLESWRNQVGATRRHGYDIDAQYYFDGLTLVAAPVLDASGIARHILAAVGISSQLTRKRAVALARDMHDAGRQLAQRLSGTS